MHLTPRYGALRGNLEPSCSPESDRTCVYKPELSIGERCTFTEGSPVRDEIPRCNE